MTTINPFQTSRVFNAPRQQVWDAWTNLDHLTKWFSPAGTSIGNCELDFRPGGSYHYSLIAPNGMAYWGKWIFTDIDPINALSVIASFSDEAGGVTRHPMSETWPLKILSVTTFEDLGNQTKLTINWQPYEGTDIEIETFNAGNQSMHQGWGGTLDQLDTYLASLGK